MPAHDSTTCSATSCALARPLRQVHDLRDLLPGLERHAAVPRTQVRRARRPSASASTTSRRRTPRSTTARAAASAPRCARRASTSPRSTPRPAPNSRPRRGSSCATGCSPARPSPGGSAHRLRRSRTGASRNRLLRLVVEKAIGIHHRAPLPRFAGRTFQRWARRRAAPARRSAGSPSSTAAEPTTTSRGSGEMTVALLEHNGLRSRCPKQDCCGLPLQSNGLFDDARGYVHRLAARLAPYARDGVDIVATSTSCSLMLKREALEILGMADDPDLQAVAASASSTSASTCCDARARRAQDRLPAPARRP